MSKIAVLDTCVMLASPDLKDYEGKVVYIPISVYQELDAQKTREMEVGMRARAVNSRLKKSYEDDMYYYYNVLDKNTLDRMNDEGGSYVRVLKPTEDLELRIDQSKVEVKADDAFLNMAIFKTEGYELHTLDFSLFQLMRVAKLNTVFVKEIRKSFSNHMYAGQRVIFVPEDEFNNPDKIDCSKFDPNEYILVRNASNIKSGGRLMKNKNGKLIQLKEKKVYKVSHKNKEQQMLIDSMMDETINTVVVTGKAGTGKTFVILAAALQLIEDGKYDEIILARSLAPLSKDDETGFLPGDLIDKLAPQFANFTSNLEALHGGKWKFKKDNENILMNAGTAIMMHKIEEGEMSIMSVANALGASLKKKILIVDEAQSLDYKVLKCLVTRMEDSAKVVLLGDVEQQTSAMGRPDSSALYIANKVLAKGKRSSVLTLVKTERGEACEENLQLLNEFESNGGI